MPRLFNPPANHSMFAQGFVVDASYSNVSPNAWRKSPAHTLDLDPRLGLFTMADEMHKWGREQGLAAVQLCKRLPGGSVRSIGCIVGVDRKEESRD